MRTMRLQMGLASGASAAALLAMLACGAGAEDETSLAGAPGEYPGPSGGFGGTSGGTDAGGDSAPPLPPEEEIESSYESPVSTGRYVWVANPVSGRVAYVDATTLEVRTTEAGNGPTHLAAVPHAADDVAVVINTISNDATLLRANASEHEIDSVTLRIAHKSNAWAISPMGRWAIAWADARLMSAAGPAEGFQDISVLDVREGEEASYRLSVGYRPVAIEYSTDEQSAYVVTQDGISVIELDAPGGPASTKLVHISDDPLEDPGTRDVSITPDGSYALVRRDLQSAIGVIRLEDGARREVDLGAEVTDLDLSHDGSRAIAVLRSISEAVVLPVPGIFEDASDLQRVKVTDAVVGSVAIAQQAAVGLLYSNASDQERVTELRFETAQLFSRTIRLHSPVMAVFLAPNGSGSIVLHKQLGADQSSVYQGAFSVLSLAPLLPPKIEGTLANPTAVAITATGTHAVIAERDDGRKVFGAYVVRMANQQVDRYSLASPPIAVGAVAQANRAFIAQEHPEGRLTFIDLEGGQARTLTGFELGAKVVDGTQN